MSETLKSILDNWIGDPTKKESPINLPFNVEVFCRENDHKLTALKNKYDELMHLYLEARAKNERHEARFLGRV